MNKENTQIYVSDYTGDDSIPVFLSFAIEHYAHRKGMSGRDAMELFAETGVLDHLVEFYDVMHQHGEEWLIEEIDHIIQSKKNDR